VRQALLKEFWVIYRLSFASRRDQMRFLFLIIVTYYYAAVSSPEKINATKLPGKHGKWQIILPAKIYFKKG
jgi:hypothetical protein